MSNYDNITFSEIDETHVSIEKYTGTSSAIEIPSEIDGLIVTEIGKEAFSECFSLTSVTIPNTVSLIGDYAFFRCKNITNIDLSNAIKYIGNCAFGWCKSLTEITIPNDLNNVGSNPFTECSKLTKINVSASSINFATINNVLFNKNKKSIITFPAHICSSYEIPNGIKEIGESAFMGCYTLKRIIIPKSTTIIKNSAFSWCNGLESIIIPEGVTTIENRAFSNCSQLKRVELPSTIKIIGENVFANCNTDIHITIKQNEYLEEYCKTNSLQYTSITDMSWLK